MNRMPVHFNKTNASLRLRLVVLSTLLILFLSLTKTFAQLPDPNNGPGGPVLVISSTTNPFSRYSVELLRAEGLNEFDAKDISTITAPILNNFDVVVLGEMTLTAPQVTLLTNWVNAGGVLIAFRPGANLASLMGINFAGTTISNSYLLVNTTSGPGKGIVNQTIQFHGTADQCTLNGASSLATLYSNATTATVYPAITINTVGVNGGKAIAFMFDLNKSIVYTRQGNPAWAGQDRDGQGGPSYRPNDLFYGAKTGDIQPDWVNLNKVQIPQADEQQRLLANIIIQGNEHKKPLPRFWYLPRDLKAAVVMTGDDHGTGGTVGRFNQYLSLSTSNTQAAIDDWIAIRGTSYIYTTPSITDAQILAFQNQGFEIALHPTTGCTNFTGASLLTTLNTQLSSFASIYPSAAVPSTSRTHCVSWSDWATKPKTEVQKGIRLNLDYYYWPSSWMGSKPGLMNGSGMPMRFADVNGTLIDSYQLPTNMPDESIAPTTLHITTLLDHAIGAEGYYGVFTANMHTDLAASEGSDDILAEAKVRNVPVISAKQMLTWLDGRNNSSFGSFVWNSNQLSFAITAASGSKNLRAMLPRFTGTNSSLRLQSISKDGSPLTITYQTIKGIQYAFFDAATGNYIAVYAANTCSTPTATLATVPSAACNIAPVSLQLNSVTGTSPFTAVINGVTYDNLVAGVPFAPASPNEISIFDIHTSIPIISNTYDGQSIEVGTKFRSTVAGYVTGVEFYKGSLNTGQHVGKLYTSTGTLLASVNFTGTNNADRGWKRASFSNPVYIQPNTTYIIAYYSPTGNYSVTDNYFTAAVTNGPLTALMQGTDGPNSVFKYGGGFPNQTYNVASNYFVDVVFVPEITSNQVLNYTLTSITDNNGCSNPSLSSVAALTIKPLPNGTIRTETPNVCSGFPISLVYTSTAGVGPFQLTINGNVYNNVISGTPFNTGIIANALTTLTLTNVMDNVSCATTRSTPVTLNIFSCGPLPVELIAFTISAQQQDVFLKWTTATEVNNKGFEVQRSKDAQSWETIGFVQGVGQSTASTNYQYTDKGLTNGRYFYRLLQVDFNERRSISSIKTITLSGKPQFELKQNVPNPFTDRTSIEYAVPAAQQVALKIYDINGKLMTTLVNEVKTQGRYVVEFNRKSLPAGMYFLKMETAGFSAVKKIVIE